MQILQFEPSWDKALSAKDRIMIQRLFQETSMLNNNSVQMTPIWQAINYKGELLKTVLIHNFSQHVLSFLSTKLRYLDKSGINVEYTFTHPTLMIEPETSMPWTFIFPVESLNNQIPIEIGQLEIVQ